MFSFFTNAKKKAAREDIKKAFAAKLKRLYLLMEASAMPDDIKVSWKSLLPEMTLPQVDQLIALLDRELTETVAYMKEQSQPEQELLAQLTKIKNDESRQRDALHKKTHAQLDDLSKQLAELKRAS